MKLFLNTYDPEVLNESIKKSNFILTNSRFFSFSYLFSKIFLVLEEIGADYIDTLIISLSDKIFTYEELPKDIILPLWSSVQTNILNKLVMTAGLSDFNAKYLEQLINSLDDKNVCLYLLF